MNCLKNYFQLLAYQFILWRLLDITSEQPPMTVIHMCKELFDAAASECTCVSQLIVFSCKWVFEHAQGFFKINI